jgi:hypothetical protein
MKEIKQQKRETRTSKTESNSIGIVLSDILVLDMIFFSSRVLECPLLSISNTVQPARTFRAMDVLKLP